MKKLKILYHHRVAAQDGQSVHIQELTKSLQEMGHELIFVGPSFRPKELGQSNSLLGLVRKLLPQHIQELLEILYDHWAYRRLYKAYKTHKPDVLYERYNLFLFAGAKLKQKVGIPYLLEVNAPLSEERANYGGLKFKKIGARIEAITWRTADMAFPVSNVLADRMRNVGVLNNHIMPLHNGINQKDYEELDNSKIRNELGLQNKVILGFTGFLREWHRLDHIIRLISSFNHEDSPHLLVVGNGPAIEPCQALAKELGIEDRVHFVGFVNRSEIPLYIMAMDIALQPAVTDYASPLKIFEYMAAGVAIVAPDQPNIKEIVTHQKNALLFQTNDREDISNKLLQLIQDPCLRAQIGQSAKETIKLKGYTWRSNAEKITTVAENLIRK